MLNRLAAIFGESPQVAGWPNFQSVNCLSALARIEPDTVKAFVETLKKEDHTRVLFKARAMSGFMLAFARVLSGLKSGYSADSIRIFFSPRIADRLGAGLNMHRSCIMFPELFETSR